MYLGHDSNHTEAEEEMSKNIEQEVADVLITALDGLVEVRTSEQKDTIPEDAMVSVHLEQQALRTASITNLFEHKVNVKLRMYYASNTKEMMNTAGNAIDNALTEVSLASTLGAYQATLIDTRAQVADNYWKENTTWMFCELTTHLR